MSDMLDYIAWRGDLPFSVSPFNEIDNIIFSMLSFIDFSGAVSRHPSANTVTLSDCLRFNRKRYPNGENFGAVIPRENNDLFEAAAKSKRFSDVYVSSFRDEIDEGKVKQFAAVTFILPDNSIYVAFRGTDDTLVGWREDFAMSYDFPTTSQRSAAEYLAEAASYHSGQIRTGGHSKGGNLSVYASAFAPADVQNRIITSYNNDGPGFMHDVISSDGYKALVPKIYTIVPQSSLVGMLLENTANLHVVESSGSNGVQQHNPYTWSVRGTGFVHLDSLSKQGKKHDAVLDGWIMNSTAEERRKLTDTIFTILESSGAKTLSDISGDMIKNAGSMIKTIAGLDKKTRANATMFIRRFGEALRAEKQG